MRVIVAKWFMVEHSSELFYIIEELDIISA